MKFLDKVGLVLFSLIVLILCIVLCSIGFGWMDPTIFSILISKALISQTGTYVLIGVSVALILLAIRCLFFSDYSSKDETDDGILMQNDDGKLLITVETLKNMVVGVAGEFSEITEARPNVIINKNNDVFIDVSIDVKKGTIIKNTSSKLQTRIKKVIKEATDLEIKSVDVKVRNADVNSEVETVVKEQNVEKTKEIKKDNKKETTKEEK